MARAKKEAALTPEERLQAALVPDWEWPYKLPENWCWLKLVESFDNHTDSKKKIKQKDYLVKGKLAVVDQGQELIGGYTNDVEKSYSGALPIVIFGDHTRCIKFVDFPFAQGADGVKVLRPKPFYLPKAFYYALQSVNIPNLGYRRHFPLFNKFSIPLPPFTKQQRIVDRIESLFTKLDEAKEKAQAVMDSFETRKAAILHKAFTGELTAKWRRTHGLSLDTWKEVAADSLFEYVTSGSRGWAKYYDESGAVFIRMGNLDHGTIELDFSDIQHVKLPNKAEGQRSRIRKNDILISITADVGMVGLVRNDDFEGYINQHIALARPVMSESAEFIAWYLVSDIGLKQMQEKQRGATKVGLSLNDIRALQLKIPLIEEQNEILKVIKMWIGKEQQSQEAAEAVLDQIDLMKKSILARAFRGELGTNDPSEESAVELLRQVIEQEDGDVIRPKAKAKRIAIPAEIKPLLSGANEEAIVKLLLKAAPQSVSTQTVMSISKKKFELMDALRNLEKKQIVSKSDSGEYSLVR